MDDITKITMLPIAARKEEVVEQLNLVSGRLEKALTAGSWRLNPDKTNRLLVLRGERSYQCTRALRKQTSGLRGEALRGMRVLGPYVPSGQGLGNEIRRRCDAARAAWRQRSTFWSPKTSKVIKRSMFMAFVAGAALSGLSCFVTSKKCTDAIDAALCRLLSYLSRGKNCWTDGQGRKRTTTLEE
eukprot:7585583-Pyramimonas_sp.AAC.1